MIWDIVDPDAVIEDIKEFGPDVLEAWDQIRPVLMDLPYPPNENLRIKPLAERTYQVMLFPEQVWVAYFVDDDKNLRLLDVVRIPDDS